MISISGHIIDSLPFEGVERISNLIEFDGPILSHYKDRFDNHYLYYWVDQDETNNRWLVWKVNEDFLYLYLGGDIPLSTLFPKAGEVLYCIDIDNHIRYSNIILTYSNNVPENYMPEPGAFYKFDLPEIYREKTKVAAYLNVLKERALFFNVEPASHRYNVTVGIQDIWSVFENICKSFSEYVSFNVKNILTQRLTDQNRIVSLAKSLSSPNRLRIVYLNLNSFHVGISADHLNIDNNSMDLSVENFGTEVLTQYKNEVLDNDFSSTEDINILINKYSNEETRKKIFDPLIKIINNDNVKLNVTDYTKTFEKSFKRVPSIEKNKLLPIKAKTTEQFIRPEQELMLAYVITDKNPEQGSLFPKDITNRLLYYKPTTKFPFEIDRIGPPNSVRPVFLNSPIQIEGAFENGLFLLSFEPLGIAISANSKKHLEERFNKELSDLYLAYIGGETIYQSIWKDILP